MDIRLLQMHVNVRYDWVETMKKYQNWWLHFLTLPNSQFFTELRNAHHTPLLMTDFEAKNKNWKTNIPFMIVNTKQSASLVSYAYAKLTTNLELIFCNICFSINTIDSPLRFLMRFFSSFLQAYILPVARTCKERQKKMENCLYFNFLLVTYLDAELALFITQIYANFIHYNYVRCITHKRISACMKIMSRQLPCIPNAFARNWNEILA